MKKLVYNLEFPSWCSEMTIFGYKFYRVPDYPTKIMKLQHLVDISSEFHIYPNTGENTITAFVDIPTKEKRAILKWGEKDKTALADIQLLLSLFSKREVFSVDNGYVQAKNGIILADSREYMGGGILKCSIPYKSSIIVNDSETKELSGLEKDIYSFDIGFQEGINQVYSIIRSEEWQLTYKGGYFLFLARMAFRRQPLESAFITCWTIWEHLFSILNCDWLSDEKIRQIDSIEKIKFLWVKYELIPAINETDHKRINKKIKDLADIRNRLVHYGRFPEKSLVYDNALLFTRLTESIIARTLSLNPSNVFNTLEGLDSFLK